MREAGDDVLGACLKRHILGMDSRTRAQTLSTAVKGQACEPRVKEADGGSIRDLEIVSEVGPCSTGWAKEGAEERSQSETCRDLKCGAGGLLGCDATALPWSVQASP